MLCSGSRETDPAGHSARQHDGAVGTEMGTLATQYALSLTYTVYLMHAVPKSSYNIQYLNCQLSTLCMLCRSPVIVNHFDRTNMT